jgi:hypothetical protein
MDKPDEPKIGFQRPTDSLLQRRLPPGHLRDSFKNSWSFPEPAHWANPPEIPHNSTTPAATVTKETMMRFSLPYKRHYSVASVTVHGVALAGGQPWLFYSPPVEAPFFSPGVDLIQNGDDLRVSAIRVSVEDGKTWLPGPGQINGLRRWEWLEVTGEQSLPFGLGENPHAVIAPLPLMPNRLFLFCGRDTRLAWPSADPPLPPLDPVK